MAGILEVRAALGRQGVGKESDTPRYKEKVLRCFSQSLGEDGHREHRGLVTGRGEGGWRGHLTRLWRDS